LLYEPLTTPQQWCEQRPCLTFGSIVVNEPLGSFLVFLLAILWMAVGVYFLRARHGQVSRVWFGIALILGGIGAAQAGISYQAFSYELKCAGREYCQLTNGFEVGYSLTQAVSVSAMLIAVAYAGTVGWWRRGLVLYAVLDAVVYIGVTVVGMSTPSAVLLSFEVLMLFALPGILMVILIAGHRACTTRRANDRPLLLAALLLLLVQAAYFTYAAAGITARLWQHGEGFYFSENDVLHVGMIAWLGYVATAVGRHLRDWEGARS